MMTLTKILSTIFFSLMALGASAAPHGDGGGSDGGGNTYLGRPLESYARTVSQLPAYQTLTGQIVANLRERAERADSGSSIDALASMLAHSFFQKIWYFVPGPLNQIPPELLNSAVPTDQAALQGYDRVWIDVGLWNQMAVEDQAKLLLHEAFMGMKILQFGTSYRQCEAAGRGSCLPSSSERDRPIRLSARDYIDVQWLTIETARDFDSISDDEWIRRIAARYKFAWRFFEIPQMLSRDELFSNVRRSTQSGYLPTFGFNLRNLGGQMTREEAARYIRDHRESCQISAKGEGDHLTLKVSSPSESLNLNIPVPEISESHLEDRYNEGRVALWVPLLLPTRQARPQGGYTMYNIWLAFDGIEMTSVYVQEMVCDSELCDEGNYYDVRGGALYICSNNGALFDDFKAMRSIKR